MNIFSTSVFFYLKELFLSLIYIKQLIIYFLLHQLEKSLKYKNDE